MLNRPILFAAVALLLAGCQQSGTASAQSPGACGADAGISLPDGFCATVFAKDVGKSRHLAVADNGTVYAALRGGGIAALRDDNGDGRADQTETFGDAGGTGLAIHDGWLYFGATTQIVRYRLGESLAPEGQPQTIVSGLPQQSQHAARALAVNAAGDLFVNIGAPANACQESGRTTGSPGQDPCPLLEGYGGIWRFAADQTGQSYSPKQRHATGIRNAVALDWDTGSKQLYLAQHGRDSLHRLWPDAFTQEQSAELPAEELFAVDAGDDFGWPYCYYDPKQNKKVLAPEYGGDGNKVGRCGDFEDPIVAFPAHWAPNALLFYRGNAFPSQYDGGAFIAFHGSWNRAPLPQQGYNVVFQPFSNDQPGGDWQVFADGFAGKQTLRSPGNAEYRPTGLAQGPDGALYISDDARGRIWRVTYTGE